MSGASASARSTFARLGARTCAAITCPSTSGATVSTATSCCFSRMRWPRICAGNISLSATASVQNDVRWISFANSSSGGSTAG